MRIILLSFCILGSFGLSNTTQLTLTPDITSSAYESGFNYGQQLAQTDCYYLQSGYQAYYANQTFGTSSQYYVDYGAGYQAGYQQEIGLCEYSQTSTQVDETSDAYLSGYDYGRTLAGYDCTYLSQGYDAYYADYQTGGTGTYYANYNAGLTAGYNSEIQSCTASASQSESGTFVVDTNSSAYNDGLYYGQYYGEYDCSNQLQGYQSYYADNYVQEGGQYGTDYNAGYRVAYDEALENCGKADITANEYQQGYVYGQQLGTNDCYQVSVGGQAAGFQSALYQSSQQQYYINYNAGVSDGYANKFDVCDASTDNPVVGDLPQEQEATSEPTTFTVDTSSSAYAEGLYYGETYGGYDCDNQLSGYNPYYQESYQVGNDQYTTDYNAAYKITYQQAMDNCGTPDLTSSEYQQGQQQGVNQAQSDCSRVQNGNEAYGVTNLLYNPENTRYSVNYNTGVRDGYQAEVVNCPVDVSAAVSTIVGIDQNSSAYTQGYANGMYYAGYDCDYQLQGNALQFGNSGYQDNTDAYSLNYDAGYQAGYQVVIGDCGSVNEASTGNGTSVAQGQSLLLQLNQIL